MERILVTGAEGFIGSNFVRMYSDKYDITSFDRNHGDIRTAEWNFLEFDCVVHLAALAGVRRSHKIPEEYWDINVNGSQQIFEQFTDIPVIYASSSSIYEWWLSPYATTKKVMEEIAGRNTLGLRFHTVYGEDSRSDMLYDQLLRKDVQYLTDHSRDWTHVEDVADAIDICIEKFSLLSDVPAIDVGNGRPVLVVDMAERVWPDNNLPVKEVSGERYSTCADASILTQLGWVPKHFILD